MSFTDEKIKVLKNLLFQYDFSKGFTSYYPETKITDGMSEIKVNIGIGGSSLLSKTRLNAEGHLALFSIVFDFFDVVVDKKLGKSDLSFSQKNRCFLKFSTGDTIVDFIEKKSFERAIEIRNKIVHNNLTVNENKELVLPNGKIYPVSLFPEINRLLFNVAIYCLDSKLYSLYDKSAALSLFKKVFSDEKIVHLLCGDVVSNMSVLCRCKENYCEQKIPKDKPLYEILSRKIQVMTTDESLIFKDGLYHGYTFLFDLNGVEVVLPAELIDIHRERTLEEFSEWTK
ncbi:hypothetical protein [Marinomonas sp.]|uniref:hypothetical protein n=1 Tax=Marinomonas sp. TaxID=1904862 RepID=UPI003BAC830B